MNKNFTLTASDGYAIPVTIYGTEHITSRPVVFIIHGFKGFKDWGFFPYTANELSLQGFCVVCLNFSHNGVEGNGTEFSRPDLFADNTFSREIRELEEVVTAFTAGYFGRRESGRMFFLGHSRGGGVAVLTAAKLPQISAVVAWAGISRLNRYSERQKAEWRRKGYFSVFNSRTNQEFRLNTLLLDDIEEYSDSVLNIEKAAASLRRPLLLIHGEQDITVPPAEARELASWAGAAYARLFIVKGTGHTFHAQHPFSDVPKQFIEVMEITKSFLNSVHN